MGVDEWVSGAVKSCYGGLRQGQGSGGNAAWAATGWSNNRCYRLSCAGTKCLQGVTHPQQWALHGHGPQWPAHGARGPAGATSWRPALQGGGRDRGPGEGEALGRSLCWAV